MTEGSQADAGRTSQGGRTPTMRLFGYFTFHCDTFLMHCHQRSNVERTFSMVKAKFGDSLRSQMDTALKNETLLKLLCHNVVVVHQGVAELGIEPVFWSPNGSATALAV